jgi:hypothetical protein
MVCFTSELDVSLMKLRSAMNSEWARRMHSVSFQGDWLRDSQDEVVSIGRNDDSESDYT